MNLCVVIAGFIQMPDTHGEIKRQEQITRLAAYILRRVSQQPRLTHHMNQAFVNNRNFSLIRQQLITEIVFQAQEIDLTWHVKKHMITPLEREIQLNAITLEDQ